MLTAVAGLGRHVDGGIGVPVATAAVDGRRDLAATTPGLGAVSEGPNSPAKGSCPAQ